MVEIHVLHARALRARMGHVTVAGRPHRLRQVHLWQQLVLNKEVYSFSYLSVLCTVNGATNWWCAKDHPEGTAVSSAVLADSCFCVMNKTQTQQQAFDSCSAIGGFLTDIENVNENNLVGYILNVSGIASNTNSA